MSVSYADATLVAAIHEALESPLSDALFGVVSLRAGFALPLCALILAGLCLRHRRDGLVTFLALLIAVGSADLLGNGLKHLFAMPRPCLDLRDALSWMPEVCSGARRGMPSNHAINYFTAATFLCLVLARRWPGVALAAVAACVGLSRVYLGRHYPSQVLAGALIGVAVGALGAFAFTRTRVGQRVRKGGDHSAAPPAESPAPPSPSPD